MANIRTFDTGPLGLQPTETGVQARAATARRSGAFFNEAAYATEQVGRETQRLGSETGSSIAQAGRSLADGAVSLGQAVLRQETHQEISHGAVGYAALNDALTQQWNNVAKTADPNDTSVAGQFREKELEPQLEKFRDGFSTEAGQQWAEARIDALRNHFFVKTAADMASRAADAVEMNVRRTANNFSNTAIQDPTAVPHLLEGVDATVDGLISSSPNLTGAVAARVRSRLSQSMREQIVKAGAVGAIQNARDPEAAAAAWSAKYPDYISGTEVKQLGAYAKTQQRTNLLLQKQTEVYKRQIAEFNVKQAANKTFSDNVTIDPVTSRPIINPKFFKDALDIANKHPDAPNAATVAKTYLDWGEAQQRAKLPIVTDPDTQRHLYDGLFSVDSPTSDTDILKAAAQNKLDAHDTSTLLALHRTLEDGAMKGPIWTDTMAAVKDQLIVSVPGIPGKDSKGITNYARFAQMFIPEYLRLKRAGTLPPNALDINDPTSLISQAMAPFKRSQAERMSDFIAGAGGLVPTPNGRMINGIPVPKLLGGIAALQYNKSTGQWRDQASGKIYNADGSEAK